MSRRKNKIKEKQEFKLNIFGSIMSPDQQLEKLYDMLDKKMQYGRTVNIHNVGDKPIRLQYPLTPDDMIKI